MAILADLDTAGIPLVLSGAQALRIYGSKRETSGIEFAVREIDADTIIEILYKHGYRLPVRVDEASGIIEWAAACEDAQAAVAFDKRGALNMYLSGERHAMLDRIDFVFDNPVPFAILKKRARVIREQPELRCAAACDLKAILEKRVATGNGEESDAADLEFLGSL